MSHSRESKLCCCQCWTLFRCVRWLQLLQAVVDRLATVFYVVPSGTAPFDLVLGSHCTTAAPPPPASEFNIWKAWIWSLLLLVPVFRFGHQMRRTSWFMVNAKKDNWLFWVESEEMNGKMTPFSPQGYTYRERFSIWPRVMMWHSNCSHGNGQIHKTCTAKHILWRGLTIQAVLCDRSLCFAIKTTPFSVISQQGTDWTNEVLLSWTHLQYLHPVAKIKKVTAARKDISYFSSGHLLHNTKSCADRGGLAEREGIEGHKQC